MKPKKRQYEPRIVEFGGPAIPIRKVDTRMGKKGFYPGDIITDIPECFFTGLVLGVDIDSGFLTVASKDWPSGDISGAFDRTLDLMTLKKRHAQHLIDSGEMIQYEEVNK